MKTLNGLPAPQLDLNPLDFQTENTNGGIENPQAEVVAFHNAFQLFAETKKLTRLSVLEVGCNYGRVSERLANHPLVSDFLGIDIHPACEAMFKENHKGSPNMRFLLMNFFAFTEDDALFDVIVVPFTTFHLFDFQHQKQFIEKSQTLAQCVILDLLPNRTERMIWAGEEFNNGYSIPAYLDTNEMMSSYLLPGSQCSTSHYPFCKATNSEGELVDLPHELFMYWK